MARVALLLLLVAPLCWGRWRAEDAALIATDSSQAIQNERANEFHLARLRNLAMVQQFRAEGLLVYVPSRMPYYYLHGVPGDYRYLRPWSKLFLDQLSREYYARFGQPLRITSMLRTVQVQRRLTRWNPNAADAVGADRSSHLTGATLDISKHSMNYRGILWMRRYLRQMKAAGYLYPVEEFHEPCFHVMVFPTYHGAASEPSSVQPRVQSARLRARPIHRRFRRTRHRIRRVRHHRAAHHYAASHRIAHPAPPSARPAEHSAAPVQPAPAVEHPAQPTVPAIATSSAAKISSANSASPR